MFPTRIPIDFRPRAVTADKAAPRPWPARSEWIVQLRKGDGSREILADVPWPGLFEAVRLSAAGCPEWPGDLDLCTDALYMQLTGKRPEEVFPALANPTAHA
jgi:hypothetical protein